MTGLLVSVRDGQEARAALDGGAAVIDVKEPLRGSLGLPQPIAGTKYCVRTLSACRSAWHWAS